jgi:hypothetical protein
VALWCLLRPQFIHNVIPSRSYHPSLSWCYTRHPTLAGTNKRPLQTPCHPGVSSTHSSRINVIPSHSYYPSLSWCYARHPTLAGTNSRGLQTLCHPSISSAHSSRITLSHLVATIHPYRGATHTTLPSRVQIVVHSKQYAILASPPSTVFIQCHPIS